MVNLRAKPAAHIGGDDGQFVFWNAHHKGRDQQPRQVRILAGGIKFVILRACIVIANAGARFHRVGDQAVVDQFKRGDVRSRGKGRVNCGTVIFDPTPVKTHVVADFVMHPVVFVGHGLCHINDGRQFGDIGHNGCGGIFGLFQTFGHHNGIGIAHMAHFAMCQNRTFGFFHRLATARLNKPTRRIAAHCRKISASHDGQNAGHCRRIGGVNSVDHAMSDVRAQKIRIGLPAQIDVGGVAAFAGQKPDVFAAHNTGADAIVFRHGILPLMRHVSNARQPVDITILQRLRWRLVQTLPARL